MRTPQATADAALPFTRHVLETDYSSIAPTALARAKVFVLDSLGVGIAGSSGPHVDALRAMLTAVSPAGGGVKPLGQSTHLGPADCAFLNAYQIHNSEYDCVHEAAVVHPMAVLLGSLLAELSSAQQPVSGRELLTAVVLGVDVAAGLGVASRSALRFFRPATAGGLAAALAVCRLRGTSVETGLDALGIAYAQLGGTMQAHTEGLPLLGMQVGFNARNALWACDMAAAGVPGTRATLAGPYGYFTLFETDVEVAPVIDSLRRIWRIEEVAHKPFPSGRATHGIVDGCLQALKQLGRTSAAADEVESVHARVPSLTARLVARPAGPDMTPNYARLCAQYVTARALQRGQLDLSDFEAGARADPASLALAGRVQIATDENPDPNALAPVTVSLTLRGGERAEVTVQTVYGHPDRPMAREAQLTKFAQNWRASAAPLEAANERAVIETVDALEDLADCRELLRMCTGN